MALWYILTHNSMRRACVTLTCLQ